MRYWNVLLRLLLASALGQADASASPKMKNFSPDVLRLKLADPARAPLSAKMLREAISGRQLLPDDKVIMPKSLYLHISYGECAPVESFYSDGRWQRQYCGRAPMEETGTWSVKSSASRAELCVINENKEEYCRTAWGRLSPDTLIMTVRGRLLESDPEYNPYRTVPLKVR